MKASGTLPIQDQRTGIYYDAATPLPDAGLSLTVVTGAVVTGDLLADTFYDLFSNVGGAYCRFDASGVAAMSLTGDSFPLPVGVPVRFYSGRFTKFGAQLSAGIATGKLSITLIAGDDDR